MDELAEGELYEAVAGLGNWHEVDSKKTYLVNKEECVACLRDLLYSLNESEAKSGSLMHLKLGEWKVFSNKLLPLFKSHREEPDIATPLLKVLVMLTQRANFGVVDQLRHLEQLQDYKEAFIDKDVFIILMRMLVDHMEMEESQATQASNSKEVFNDIVALLRNLVSVPDPTMGDAGFTPMRKHMQLVYIKNFHDEGVFDVFQLFAEGLADQGKDIEQKAWEIADILYHVCTCVNPEELTQGRKEKDKSVLKELLQEAKVGQSVRMPQASRHSRFGTVFQTRTKEGGVHIYSSVNQTEQVSKGGRLWAREFRDPTARNDKKRNAFHDPFFVDLEEGSVRDHNSLNPHIRNNLDSAKRFDKEVMDGLRKFFEEFVQKNFSSLISVLRSTLGRQARSQKDGGRDLEFDRPKMLNFMAWIMEFQRHLYAANVAKAKNAQEPTPVFPIANLQGGMDLDMLHFTTARFRQYGKESGIHASHLVIVLRALLQQVKVVDLLMDSKDADTKDCGEILTQNLIKEDVLGHLTWIMNHFRSSGHDPRVMSYSVEVFHFMLRCMKRLAAKMGQTPETLEFQVEKGRGRSTTSVDKEIASLACAATVENLFHLLEKYKRHSPQLNSMLVKLLYQIIRVQPSNIVVFFELSYFLRINRMWADPLLRDKHAGRRYQEMVQLLQYILRQFFKCAEKNKMVFVELLFRKVPEKGKNQLLESHTSEFAAILDNYENEDYKRLFDHLEAGESLDALRKQKAPDGAPPWTEEEDEVLRQRFHMYASHPLCATLLTNELPEGSHRTARMVEKRLEELGLIAPEPRRGGATDRSRDIDGVDLDAAEPAKKKARMDGDEAGAMRLDGAPQSPDIGNLATEVDESMLENDLERLLDAAMDAQEDAAAAPGGKWDLEMDLEAMLEKAEEEQGAMPGGSAADQTASVPPGQPQPQTQSQSQTQTPSQDVGGMNLEQELSAMMSATGESKVPTQSRQTANTTLLDSPATQPATQSASQPGMGEGWLEDELSGVMATGASQASQGPSAAAAPQTGSATRTQIDTAATATGRTQIDTAAAARTQIDTATTAASIRSGTLAASEEGDEEDDDARQFWEDAVQEGGNGNSGSQGQHASQSVAATPNEVEPEELELDLEKMMDEGGAEGEENNEY